jgi:hypothetical protein
MQKRKRGSRTDDRVRTGPLCAEEVMSRSIRSICTGGMGIVLQTKVDLLFCGCCSSCLNLSFCTPGRVRTASLLLLEQDEVRDEVVE